MYNDTQNASNLIELQLGLIRQGIEADSSEALTEEEKNSIVSAAFRKFFTSVGKPLMPIIAAEYGHLPYIEDYNETVQGVTDDVSIAYHELEHIGTSLSEAFNYAQNEKTKLKNRINTLSSMATDFNLMANESEANVVYFKDSFTDYSNVDTKVSAGTPVNISTSEGIATLARTKSIDCESKAKIVVITGNGDAGNYQVARRTQVATDDGSIVVNAKYASEDGAHDDPAAIIDGRPDTWFEYQLINMSEADKEITKGYNIEWAKGKEYGDKLRLRIIIDLYNSQEINWIDVGPYIPEKGNGSIYIYSIKTSEDGIDYESVSEGRTVINTQVNLISHTYEKDKIFVGNVYNNEKIESQGTFWFAPRKARFVEIVIDQDQPFTETVGHTYYEKVVTQDGISTTTSIRVPSTQVPDAVVNGELGKYPLDKNQYINKGIDLFDDGWRYCIGIKDIKVFNYQFAEKSEMITKPFITTKPIKEISLYANEVIPEIFTQDLSKANDWVQYYISIDDINWQRISPMHQQPIAGKTDFPPKVYRINSKEVIEDKIENPLYGYVYTDSDVYGVRLKVIVSRPLDIENSINYTPILEDYSLRVALEDNFLKGGLV